MDRPPSQAEHDRLVGVIAATLLRRGERDVRAVVPGYRRPQPIRWRGDERGHVPDVTTADLVVEVETAELLSDPQTAARWQLTAGYADRVDAAFVVVVPKGAEPAARALLTTLALDGQVIGA